jgi:hypothetical protein
MNHRQRWVQQKKEEAKQKSFGNVLSWSTNIEKFYPNTDLAVRETQKLKDAGMIGLTIPYKIEPVRQAWLENIISKFQMQKIAILGWTTIFGYARPNTDRVWVSSAEEPKPGEPEWEKHPSWMHEECLHTSYKDYPHKYRNYLVCHSQNNQRTQSLYRYVMNHLSQAKPDIAIIDHEFLMPPESQEKAYPGIVTNCSLCQSVSGANAGWQDMVENHRIIADSINPDMKMYYFRTGRYFPQNAGDGECPGFYFLKNHGDKSKEELQRLIDTEPYNGVKDGYPWLMLQPYKKQPMPTEQDMRDWCTVLRDNGAKGFSAYCDFIPNNTVTNLIKVGSEVFKQ